MIIFFFLKFNFVINYLNIKIKIKKKLKSVARSRRKRHLKINYYLKNIFLIQIYFYIPTFISVKKLIFKLEKKKKNFKIKENLF